jgi:predicted Fe-Mo cluster-binding NifX family protein
MLTRAQILAADDTRRQVVKVPEWGGEVTVSVMTGRQRDAWEASMAGQDAETIMRDARAKLVAACVIGEDGAPLFTQADVDALSGKSAAALDRVVKVAQRLNRIGEKDLEDLKGN